LYRLPESLLRLHNHRELPVIPADRKQIISCEKERVDFIKWLSIFMPKFLEYKEFPENNSSPGIEI